MSAYREFPPSRALYPLVACRWLRRVPEQGSERSTLVLPDGCVDLLWRDDELVVAGPDQAAQPTPVRPGETILGLRLRPGIAGAVLGVPASEVLDSRVPLEDVLGRPTGALTERLGESNGEESL